MCELCHEESDNDYDGESVEEKRRKATRSIIRRHPELGLDPNEVTFRFAPRAEEQCVRVNIKGQSPRYEIHVPSYIAQAMSSAPSLRGIAMAAWVGSDKSYEEICQMLNVHSHSGYGAFFVSEKPALNPARADDVTSVNQYEQDIQDHLEEQQ